MSITSKQLEELSERVNARLREFSIDGHAVFDRLSAGVVRIAYEEIELWWENAPRMAQAGPVALSHACDESFSEATAVTPNPDPPKVDPPQNGYVPHAAPNVTPIAAPILSPEAMTPLVPRRPRTLAAVDATDSATEQLATGIAADLSDTTSQLDDLRGRIIGNKVPERQSDEDGDEVEDQPPHRQISDNRRAQLEEIKQRRKLAQDAEERQSRRESGVTPTRDELIAELTRQAMGGVMPSQAAFNDAKPATWSTADAQTKRLGVSWTALAWEAGLQPQPGGRRANE